MQILSTFFIYFLCTSILHIMWCHGIVPENVNVKLLFTTTCFVGFYLVPNLIVIIFNLLYPVCIVGFYCKGYVIERVVWRLKHLKTEEDFAGISWLSIPQNISCALHVLECEELGQMETAVSCEYPASKAFLRDTREAFCSAYLSSLKHTFCAYTIYTHITHKCEESFWEKNPSQTAWELEIVILTILYTFFLGISSYPTSPFPYHSEVDSPNTYHTLWECQVKFWCC